MEIYQAVHTIGYNKIKIEKFNDVSLNKVGLEGLSVSARKY